MGRHTKQTVDYFPHYVHHGKTLRILQNLWGNDGYAFFYKLLELLGDAEGHYYDCRDEESKEYLAAETNVQWISGAEILNKLSSMRIIDTELWENGVIWMQTFVDSIQDVYRKRSAPVPEKPQISNFLPPEIDLDGISSAGNPPETDKFRISSAGNRQSKVKYSKVNKTILKDDDSVNTESLSPNVSGDDKSTAHCPHSEIVKLYHEILPSLQKVKEWTEQRQKILRTRWNEKEERQTLEWWRLFFQYVSESDFLMGRIKPTFQADLEWLVRPKNFVKVIEGKYHRNGNVLLSQSSAGILGWADRERKRMEEEDT